MLEHQVQPGPAEGQQPLHRRRTRAEWRRSAHHRRLPVGLGVVEQRAHQPLAGVEPPEHGALADAGPRGDRVHRHRVEAELLDELGRGAQERLAVARGVAALRRRRGRAAAAAAVGMALVTLGASLRRLESGMGADSTRLRGRSSARLGVRAGIEPDHGPF